MATRLFPPFYQFEDADGAPLVGGTLEFYDAGTLTPKDTYSDAGMTIPNGTITLNSLGRSPVAIFAGVGDYRVILKDADGVVIGDEDPVTGSAANTTTSAGSSFRNLLINGDFAINQRGHTSVNDDEYCLDRWYALTQTGAVGVAQQTVQANGIPTNLRMTQSQATAQRMGIAQIIEGNRCRFLRGGSVTFSGTVRHSIAAPIRYAILAWTGTEDAVTSDVVNDWTSASYTAGGFFNSTTLTVVAVGSVTPSSATVTALPPLTGTVSTATNNIIVMVWTEGATAQNATLDPMNLQLEPGAEATAFEYLPAAVTYTQAQRYWRTFHTSLQCPAVPAGEALGVSVFLSPPMRVPPAVTRTATVVVRSNVGAAYPVVSEVSADGMTVAIVAAAVGNSSDRGRIWQADAEL